MRPSFSSTLKALWLIVKSLTKVCRYLIDAAREENKPALQVLDGRAGSFELHLCLDQALNC